MANRRALVMFLIALIMSLGAAWIANNWLQTRLTPEANKAQGKPAVVAALKIPFGQKIEGAHVKIVYLPDDSIPPGAYTETEEVIGKVPNQTLFPGETLISERIVDQVQGSTLSALISPKKRAMTVRVNDVIGVAGFLLPGNRVDVVASRKQGDRMQARTILQDLKVLAVDQTASPEKDQPLIVRAVTLEMSPGESEILVRATNEGSVQLTLRNPLDDEDIPEPERVPKIAELSQSADVTLVKEYVTLRAHEVIGVTGFSLPKLLPGSRVNVIATTHQDNEATEDTLLQDVKVVAVLHTGWPGKGRLFFVRAVTLEVTHPQSKILASTTKQKSIQLSLRNPLDNELIAEGEKVDTPSLTRNLNSGGYTLNVINSAALAQFSGTL